MGEQLEQKRVLIVDDNRDAAELLHMLLDMQGYIVEIAGNGEEGLVRTTQFRPQVILSDINMPGMSGYEFAKQVRAAAATPAPFLIAITGAGSDLAGRALAAGFDRCLTKPCSLEDILAPIDNYFGAASG